MTICQSSTLYKVLDYLWQPFEKLLLQLRQICLVLAKTFNVKNLLEEEQQL